MATATHDQLWKVAPLTRRDYCRMAKRGEVGVDAFGADCSGGCRWFQELDGEAGMDWGVCFNPRSEWSGMLVFEHFGCPHFRAERKAIIE